MIVTEPILAYHFVNQALRDGRPIPIDGEWLVHSGKVDMCVSGLHASRHPFDALTYAPGTILCQVLVRGEVQEQSDKLVATERCILARFDATDLLQDFARQCALDVVHLWNASSVVIQYLQTGDKTLRGAAAGDAAWAAARAAGAAAWAAEAALAAWAASGAAAWGADAAARAARAADEATRAVQRLRFSTLVDSVFQTLLPNIK